MERRDGPALKLNDITAGYGHRPVLRSLSLQVGYGEMIGLTGPNGAGQTQDTEENFAAEIAGWQTKRQRGDNYRMGAGTWYEQMDAFQEIFVGMTVDEVEEWFAKYTSDRNGRPLLPNSTNAQVTAKFDALSADEQAMLADATTRATVSLNDPHGDIVSTIKASYANRVDIDLTVE